MERTEPTKHPQRRFILGFPAWGTQYVASLVEMTLPMMLAEGNLPWLARNAETIVAIATTAESRPSIDASPAVQAIKRLCAVRYFLIEPHSEKYNAFGHAHQTIFETRQSPTDVFCMLTADIGVDDHFLKFLHDRIAEGYDAVMATGPRTRITAIREALAHYHSTDGAISVPPRALAALTLRHLHPTISVQKWAPESRPRAFAAQNVWGDLETGMYVSCFHLHPVAMTNLPVSFDIKHTIDDGLVADLYGPEANLYIHQDSDEMFCCEFSVDDLPFVWARFTTEEQRIRANAQWCALHPDPLMFLFARHGLFVHSNDDDGAAYKAEANRVLTQIGDLVPTALDRVDEARRLGALAIIRDLREGRPTGIWGLGTDFRRFLELHPPLEAAIRSSDVRLYDADRAGTEMLGKQVLPPNDLSFTGTLYPLPSHPLSHWGMLERAPTAFPQAEIIDLYL